MKAKRSSNGDKNVVKWRETPRELSPGWATTRLLQSLLVFIGEGAVALSLGQFLHFRTRRSSPAVQMTRSLNFRSRSCWQKGRNSRHSQLQLDVEEHCRAKARMRCHEGQKGSERRQEWLEMKTKMPPNDGKNACK